MKKVIFSHPILDHIELEEEHAKNLEELEKVNPSGWVKKEVAKKEIADAVNDRTDKGDNQKPNKK
jgi:inorganic pyrophosphatase